eukprot:TRINITY_DN23426_c0_g1_i1.p1 TRINITY_DN23426_c0_g1~~TRINITY_DN23426_c0_g1_i1.p1  ORF type:complete len:272 (+),score=22.09 TRINITY_DN23426_c0_g1_i1:58-816(+)
MPREKKRAKTPPRDVFSLSELLANEAGPIIRKQPDSKPSENLRLRWSSSIWCLSKPVLSESNRVAFNRYQETSVCSTTPLIDECTVRVLEDCNCALGVCIIEAGRMKTLWKYESDGTKFAYHMEQDGLLAEPLSECPVPQPYGTPYGEGDLVTVCIKDNVLSFRKNGEDIGGCFSLPHDEVFYLRGYMNGRSFRPGHSGGGKLEIIAICENCADEGRLRCPCEAAAYCGKECQKKHWKVHKASCKLARKSEK